MKLLLINPRYPESFWSFGWAVREILPGKKTVNPPLGLATLAALCPPSWEVAIVDENVDSIPLAPEADVVGVCGMGVQFPRQRELLAYYRRNGYYVVAGGSFASLCPERYTTDADTVVAGEAEYIWPQFCADYERGSPRPLYCETGVVALTDSPTPRFDLLKLDRYTTATLQFSRGCPYRCEFCDIIVMFGRKPRHKSLAQVERELDALRARGVRNAFFVDDNLIGHRAVARDLLQFLKNYQARHGYRFRFGTEVSLNLAQDRELLRLFREACFEWVFVGIESADPATLKATLKTQNLHEDTLTAVRRIYSHGIDVLAGFIVGFDNDTLATFGQQHAFIMRSGIQAAMVGLLTALPRTPLHARLKQEGRLRDDVEGADNTRPHTNVQPKRMSYEAMVAAYEALYRGLLTDRNIAIRIRNKLRHMASPVYEGEYPLAQQLGIVVRLLFKGILRGGPRRFAHFVRSLPLMAPRKLPLAVVDWIAGLSMRDYIDRHFGPAPASTTRRLEKLLRRMGAGARGWIPLTVSLPTAAAPMLDLRLTGDRGKRWLRRTGRRLGRFLAGTQATLTLRIEALHHAEMPGLDYLLGRLARYGDRVSIVIDRKLRDIVRIDSSVFHLVLVEP
ncbi:MAG: radical SAM protein [Betaproteobacteria bacterium]|nr:radical SAM protein [Betaproteobacteria bacterium]